ncbi:MAG: hypothetical protein WDM96_02460 [Lacunisphaera sp.]
MNNPAYRYLRITVCAFLLAAASSAAVYGQVSKKDPVKDKDKDDDDALPVLAVLTVESDYTDHLLTISARGLGQGDTFDGKMKLYIPGQGRVVLPVVSFDPVAREVVVAYPATLEAAPATYLLTVIRTKAGEKLRADFGVTFDGKEGIKGK